MKLCYISFLERGPISRTANKHNHCLYTTLASPLRAICMEVNLGCELLHEEEVLFYAEDSPG